ncbi:MAG: hypothetical protein ABII82_05455 [Verrucomicrobiota bacterium]
MLTLTLETQTNVRLPDNLVPSVAAIAEEFFRKFPDLDFDADHPRRLELQIGIPLGQGFYTLKFLAEDDGHDG